MDPRDKPEGDERAVGERGLPPASPPLDAALVAVVAGRAQMDVGDIVALEEVARHGLNVLGADHLAGAVDDAVVGAVAAQENRFTPQRSEEHTTELQSLMRISYAVFCMEQ